MDLDTKNSCPDIHKYLSMYISAHNDNTAAQNINESLPVLLERSGNLIWSAKWSPECWGG